MSLNPATAADPTISPAPRRRRWPWVVFAAVAMISAAAITFGAVNPLAVHIEMAGEPDVTLEVGEAYNDAGAEAYLGARHFPERITDVEVMVAGDVDASQPGDYTITYSAEWWRYSAKAERRVHVVDSEAPTIELVGETSMTITEGEEFSDPGWSARDNVDGDITANVVSAGSVDTATAGTYELTYSVVDSSGNEAKARRDVVVEPKPAPAQKPAPTPAPVVAPGSKVIYLTFDDGPSAHTAQLLDVLGAHGVKATFFVTGAGDPALIGRMAREGHAVGAHTYSHHYRTIYASEEAFMADLEQVNDVIEAQTGQRTNIMRFAGGSSNTVSRFNPGIMTRLTAQVQDTGYAYFDWNVSSGDATSQPLTAAQIAENVTAGVAKRDPAIVLQHDTNPNSVAAVNGIITWGLANGYTFLPLEKSSPQAHHPVAN